MAQRDLISLEAFIDGWLWYAIEGTISRRCDQALQTCVHKLQLAGVGLELFGEHVKILFMQNGLNYLNPMAGLGFLTTLRL